MSDNIAERSEEDRLRISHYRSEFERIAIFAANCARSKSTDIRDWQADMLALIDRAQHFMEV